MKTGASFNMSKETKRLLTHTSGSNKSDWKRMMIEAEVAEIKAKQQKFKEKQTQGED
jgi:hypothetical protein